MGKDEKDKPCRPQIKKIGIAKTVSEKDKKHY